MARVYVTQTARFAVSSSITLLQIVASASAGLEIVRAWASQDSSTSSVQNHIAILRKTGSATVTACVVTPLSPADAAALATAGGSATGEGTDGLTLIQDSFNILNGWLYLPVPEERIYVPPGSTIALKFMATPATSASFVAGFVFREIP